MTNKDALFLFILAFWASIAFSVFLLEKFLGTSVSISIGGIIYFIMILFYEKVNPFFRNWLNTKINKLD